jgi:hypothetical protein
MARLRFSMKAILLLTALFAGCTGWWVTLPSRTIETFVSAVENRDTDLLAVIYPGGRDVHEEFSLGGPLLELDCSAAANTRTIPDILAGRCEFTIKVLFVGQTYWGSPHETSFDVRVERGRVLPAATPALRNFSMPLAELGPLSRTAAPLL